jgi:hypothetical protein
MRVGNAAMFGRRESSTCLGPQTNQPADESAKSRLAAIAPCTVAAAADSQASSLGSSNTIELRISHSLCRGVAMKSVLYLPGKALPDRPCTSETAFSGWSSTQRNVGCWDLKAGSAPKSSTQSHSRAWRVGDINRPRANGLGLGAAHVRDQQSARNGFGRRHLSSTTSPLRASVDCRRAPEMSLECFREARLRLVADAPHRFGDRQAFRVQQLRRT